jgi:hypothetical protein
MKQQEENRQRQERQQQIQREVDQQNIPDDLVSGIQRNLPTLLG